MDRHRFDLISFLFGLLFAGFGGVWLMTEEVLDPDITEWFWPVVLVAAGAIVLASTLTSQRNRRNDEVPDHSPIED